VFFIVEKQQMNTSMYQGYLIVELKFASFSVHLGWSYFKGRVIMVDSLLLKVFLNFLKHWKIVTDIEKVLKCS
jgi:hypothetical protein